MEGQGAQPAAEAGEGLTFPVGQVAHQRRHSLCGVVHHRQSDNTRHACCGGIHESRGRLSRGVGHIRHACDVARHGLVLVAHESGAASPTRLDKESDDCRFVPFENHCGHDRTVGP